MNLVDLNKGLFLEMIDAGWTMTKRQFEILEHVTLEVTPYPMIEGSDGPMALAECPVVVRCGYLDDEENLLVQVEDPRFNLAVLQHMDHVPTIEEAKRIVSRRYM